MRPSSLARWLVLAAFSMACAAAFAAPACRPAPPRLLVERVMSAACEACWQQAAPEPAPPRTHWLDWIAPAGDDAPMSAAALAEAGRHADTLDDARTAVRRTTLRPALAAAMRVVDGPPLTGYVGLRIGIAASPRLPEGTRVFAALVERVAAGDEGTPIARRLVRSVVGPWMQGRAARDEWIAVRVPENAQAERLGSIVWAESAEGRVLALAEASAVGCR